MKKPYKIVSGASTPNRRELADWLAKDGQLGGCSGRRTWCNVVETTR